MGVSVQVGEQVTINLWVLPLSAGGYFLDQSIDMLLNKDELGWNGGVMRV